MPFRALQPPQQTEAMRQYNEWGRQTAADITKQLRAAGLKGWVVKWIDWDDPSRLANSSVGPNITDFRYQLMRDANWMACFVVGTENFDPTGVRIRMDKVPCVWRDPADGVTKPRSLYDLLRHAGRHWAHKGLPPGCDLTLAPISGASCARRS